METEPHEGEHEPTPAAVKLEKADYEKLRTVLESCEPLAKKINSARITQRLADLKGMVVEELKELVYQDYVKGK